MTSAPSLREVAAWLAEIQGWDLGQEVGGTTHKPPTPFSCARCGKTFSNGFCGVAVFGTSYIHHPSCPESERAALARDLREIDLDFAEGGAVAHEAHRRWGG